MSILVDGNTRVVVQGMTGQQGRLHSEYSLKYGTNIVAGVTPGRGGEEICGLPVYDTVHEDVEKHQATASVFLRASQGGQNRIRRSHRCRD